MAENKESTKITRKDIHDKLWEARDFEISHLWQRSIFLATFIVLLFTAYFSVLDKAIDNKKEYNEYSYELSTGNTLRTNTSVISYEEENLSNKEHMTTIILEGICLMGFSFSTLWVCMARGSKYMYERIENGINTTYDDLDAWDPSVRTKIEKEYCDCLWNLGDYTWMPRHGAQPLSRYNYKPFSTDGSTFSPSKINIIIGYVFMLAWMLLAIVPIILFISCSIISIVIIILIFVLPISFILFFFISYWSLSGRYKNVWAFIHSLFLAIHHNDRTPDRNQVRWINDFILANQNHRNTQTQNTENSVYERMEEILRTYSSRIEDPYQIHTINEFLTPIRTSIFNLLAHERLNQIFELSIMPRTSFNQVFSGYWLPFYNSNELLSVIITSNRIILNFNRNVIEEFEVNKELNNTGIPTTRLFADTNWNAIRRGERYNIIEDTECFRLISKTHDNETIYIIMDISESLANTFYNDNQEQIMRLSIYSEKKGLRSQHFILRRHN